MKAKVLKSTEWPNPDGVAAIQYKREKDATKSILCFQYLPSELSRRKKWEKLQDDYNSSRLETCLYCCEKTHFLSQSRVYSCTTVDEVMQIKIRWEKAALWAAAWLLALRKNW